MISIKGKLIPEVKILGKYELKETRNGNLDVYKNGDYLITFAACSIHNFYSEKELEDELSLHEEDEYEDIFGNFGEYMAAQHDLGRQGSINDYINSLNV